MSASPDGLSPACLGRLVRDLVDAGEWLEKVMFCTDERWFERLELTDNYEIWLLSWLPSQHTGFHDHGEAAGAYAVAQGELQERTAIPASRKVRCRTAEQGTVSVFGKRHLHDMRNVSSTPAISVHAYSPPLTAMRRYQMTPSGLTVVRTEHAELDW